MKNTEWKDAYDDVKHAEGEVILKIKDSVWGVLLPGSMTLINDTIYVNQENGHDNICLHIGNVRAGESVIVKHNDKKKLFLVMNDSVIEYNGHQFEKSKIPVIYGCWCTWK